MTLYTLTPSLWAAISFALFVLYLLLDTRLALAGVAATLLSFCAAILGMSMLVQAVSFFIYFAVLLLFLLRAGLSKPPVKYAIVLCAVDNGGGIIRYKGKNYIAYPRDRLMKYNRGDVLKIDAIKDGVLTSTRA